MKATLAASLLVYLGIAGCVGTPHRDPSDISSLEVAVYKKGLDMGCRDGGRGRGDTAAVVDSFCDCVSSTLNAKLSDAEWQQATFAAQQRRDAEERQVMAPHMPALAQCRKPQ